MAESAARRGEAVPVLLQRRGSASAAAEERQCQCCCGAGTAEVLSHELSHACAQHDRHARMICSRRIGGTVHMFMCMHLSHRDDGDSSHALRDWSAYTRLHAPAPESGRRQAICLMDSMVMDAQPCPEYALPLGASLACGSIGARAGMAMGEAGSTAGAGALTPHPPAPR